MEDEFHESSEEEDEGEIVELKEEIKMLGKQSKKDCVYLPLYDVDITEITCTLMEELRKRDEEMFCNLTNKLSYKDLYRLLHKKYSCLDKYRKITSYTQFENDEDNLK